MTARISLVAVLAVMAGSAFAQEPPAAPSTTEQAPSMQNDQMAPSTTPAPATEAPAATPEPTPAPAPAPAPDKEAAAPAPSGSSDVAASALKKSEDDAKMVPALNASVDKVEAMDIYDANGKKIAEVTRSSKTRTARSRVWPSSTAAFSASARRVRSSLWTS